MLNYTRAHSHRLIGSVIYDGLVIMGILMIAGAMALPVNQWITGDTSDGSYLLYQVYLLVVVLSYFLYFWKKSGQTVGMKAWRIKLISREDSPLTVKQLLLRLVVAIPAYLLLFLGVLWQYWDKDQLNWQDRASKTKIVYLPKKKTTSQ